MPTTQPSTKLQMARALKKMVFQNLSEAPQAARDNCPVCHAVSVTSLSCLCNVSATLCHVSVTLSHPHHVPVCHVSAMYLPRLCHVSATSLPRLCHISATSLSCLCHVSATSLPCLCHARLCHVSAASLPCLAVMSVHLRLCRPKRRNWTKKWAPLGTSSEPSKDSWLKTRNNRKC